MSAADVLAITGAVQYGTVIVGIAAVAAACAVVYVAVKGAKMLLAMVRS